MDLCAYESEEHEHGVGTGANTTHVYGNLKRFEQSLLLIEKARGK